MLEFTDKELYDMEAADEAAQRAGAANARTIAAAPDMLAVLRLCADFIENATDDDPERASKFIMCREAWRNALAKAEGLAS